MRLSPFITLLFVLFSLVSCSSGKHLFILSGQSNMQALNPEDSFVPLVTEKFGKGKIIVVKDAKGGQPIRRWYRGWEQFNVDVPNSSPSLYDSLLHKVHSVIKKEKIKTATFVWMQGERDAREKLGGYYEKSLLGLYSQLGNCLNRRDLNFIIGRLSDFGLSSKKYPHWGMIREIQVKIAESNPRFDWVNTDDLNGGYNRRGEVIKNDLHMSVDGYVIMGKRFAEKSIELIEKNK